MYQRNDWSYMFLMMQRERNCAAQSPSSLQWPQLKVNECNKSSRHGIIILLYISCCYFQNLQLILCLLNPFSRWKTPMCEMQPTVEWITKAYSIRITSSETNIHRLWSIHIFDARSQSGWIMEIVKDELERWIKEWPKFKSKNIHLLKYKRCTEYKF